jgi:putative solute:sodium symporter small subunit
MSRSDRDNYWRQTRQLTAGLFVIWVLITFVMNWFARELNEIVIFGFPLGFYMGAQGILIIYLLIIWFYNRRMRALDEEYRIEDD